MKPFRSVIRVSSFCLLLSFSGEQLLLADPEFLARKVDELVVPKLSLNFKIPESIAAAEDSWQGQGSTKTLYLLQDAHTNESGQINLSKTLDILLKEDKDLKYIFVEAGQGNDSLSFLRDKASLKKRIQTAKDYLKKGLLHGEEYLDLTSDHNIILWGVEDFALYQKAIEAYRDVKKDRAQFQDYLLRIQSTLNILKPRILNPNLLAFDKKHTQYLKEETPLSEHLQTLTEESQKRNINLLNFPHLKALNNLKDEEVQIDFKKANEEQQIAIQSLPKEDQEELLEYSKKKSPAKLGGQDLSALYTLLEEKVSKKSDYPNLSKYFSYLKASKSINPKDVLREQNQLETALFDALVTTQEERVLLHCQSKLRILQKLFDLKLTPEEYEEYKDDAKTFTLNHLIGFINKKIMDFGSLYDRAAFLEEGYDTILKNSETFYELTQDRDQAFLKGLTDKMDQEHQNKAVLITGGFHAPNLKRLFKDQNISFVSITPQVYQETNQKRYEELLLNQKIDARSLTPASTYSPNMARLVAAMNNPSLGSRLAENLEISADIFEGRPEREDRESNATNATREQDVDRLIMEDLQRVGIQTLYDLDGWSHHALDVLSSAFLNNHSLWVGFLDYLSKRVRLEGIDALYVDPEVTFKVFDNFIRYPGEGKTYLLTEVKTWPAGNKTLDLITYATVHNRQQHRRDPDWKPSNENGGKWSGKQEAALTLTPGSLARFTEAGARLASLMPVDFKIDPGKYVSPIQAGRPMTFIFQPFYQQVSESIDFMGLGDFGTAIQYVDLNDKLAGERSKIGTQLLPFKKSKAFDSPYSEESDLIDPRFVSIALLIKRLRERVPSVDFSQIGEYFSGKLKRMEAVRLKNLNEHTIDHGEITQLKDETLRIIWDSLQEMKGSDREAFFKEFEDFKQENADWLPDQALFSALVKANLLRDPAKGWDSRSWEPALSRHEAEAVQNAMKTHRDEVEFISFVEFVAQGQLKDLIAYADSKGQKLAVDIPYAPNAAIVWMRPELMLDASIVTQSVPPEAAYPAGQRWQFVLFDYQKPETIEYLVDRLRRVMRFAPYVRLDHDLGYIRNYESTEDTQGQLTLEKLGIFEEMMRIREQTFEKVVRILRAENQNESEKKYAIEAEWVEAAKEALDLMTRRLYELKGGHPALAPGAIDLTFDDNRNLRQDAMIVVGRAMPQEDHGKDMPKGSGWGKFFSVAKAVASAEHNPMWREIRLTPSSGANDNGFMLEYLFGEEGPQADDSLRPNYFRLVEKSDELHAEFVRVAQESGGVLIAETLGVVPVEVQNSRQAVESYSPAIWGLDPSSPFYRKKVLRRSARTFDLHDSTLPKARWEKELSEEERRAFLSDVWPDLKPENPDYSRHLNTLTEEVNELLLAEAFLADSLIVLPTWPALLMLTEDFRLNSPGTQMAQWSKAPPVTVKELLRAAEGQPADERAVRAVSLFRRLQKKHEEKFARKSGQAFLGSHPDVESGRILMTKIPAGGLPTKPFIVEAFVDSIARTATVVLVDENGQEIARYPMQGASAAGLEGVTRFEARLTPTEAGRYRYYFEIQKSDGVVEKSAAGSLVAFNEGDVSNSLSPNYFLKQWPDLLEPPQAGARLAARVAAQLGEGSEVKGVGNTTSHPSPFTSGADAIDRAKRHGARLATAANQKIYGITGGSGSVGTQLIRQLLAQPDTKEIYALTRKTDSDTIRKLAAGHPNVHLIEGDLLNIEALNKLVDSSDVVYHLGGWSGVGKISTQEALVVNGLSTALLAQLAREKQKRLVFASTVHSYMLSQKKDGITTEKDLILPTDIQAQVDAYYTELKNGASKILSGEVTQTPTFSSLPQNLSAGPSLYSFTKLVGEKLVSDYSQALTLRFSNVYGPGDETDRAVPKFVREMAKAAPEDQKTFVPGRQNAYIYVGDLVKALHVAANVTITEDNKVINVTDATPVTQEDLFLQIKDVTGSDAQVAAMSQEQMQKLGLVAPPPLTFDTALMQRDLGLAPEQLTDLRTGLNTTKQWLLDSSTDDKWRFPDNRGARLADQDATPVSEKVLPKTIGITEALNLDEIAQAFEASPKKRILDPVFFEITGKDGQTYPFMLDRTKKASGKIQVLIEADYPPAWDGHISFEYDPKSRLLKVENAQMGQRSGKGLYSQIMTELLKYPRAVQLELDNAETWDVINASNNVPSAIEAGSPIGGANQGYLSFRDYDNSLVSIRLEGTHNKGFEVLHAILKSMIEIERNYMKEKRKDETATLDPQHGPAILEAANRLEKLLQEHSTLPADLLNVMVETGIIQRVNDDATRASARSPLYFEYLLRRQIKHFLGLSRGAGARLAKDPLRAQGSEFAAGARLTSRYEAKDYGLVSGSLSNQKKNAKDALAQYFIENGISSQDSQEISNTLIRMKEGSVDLLEKWGVIDLNEAYVLLGIMDPGGLNSLIKNNDFAIKIKTLINTYPEDKKHILLKRLIPMNEIDRIVTIKMVPESVVYEALKMRFSLIPFIDQSIIIVANIQTQVGGKKNAWAIVIRQGHEKAEDWVTTTKVVVSNIQTKVGGESNAWTIVIAQGYEKADAWVTTAQAVVSKIQTQVVGKTKAWQIVLAQGHEKAEAWVTTAKVVVSKIQTQVGGEAHAWQIVIAQGHKKAEAWVKAAQAVVSKIQTQVGGKKNAWAIVIGQGHEKAEDWVTTAQAVVSNIHSKVGGKANAWTIVIGQGHEKAGAWVTTAQAVVSNIQTKVGGEANAWAIVIKQGHEKAEGWVTKALPYASKLIEAGRTSTEVWDTLTAQGLDQEGVGDHSGARLAARVATQPGEGSGGNGEGKITFHPSLFTSGTDAIDRAKRHGARLAASEKASFETIQTPQDRFFLNLGARLPQDKTKYLPVMNENLLGVRVYALTRKEGDGMLVVNEETREQSIYDVSKKAFVAARNRQKINNLENLLKTGEAKDLTEVVGKLFSANHRLLPPISIPTAKGVLIDSLKRSDAFYESLIFHFSKALEESSELIFAYKDPASTDRIRGLINRLGIENSSQFKFMTEEELAQVDLPTSILFSDEGVDLEVLKNRLGPEKHYFALASSKDEMDTSLYALRPLARLMDLVAAGDTESAFNLYSQMTDGPADLQTFLSSLRGALLVPFVSQTFSWMVDQAYTAERALDGSA